MITIDDFAKVEIRIGTILSAVKVPEADRLLQLIFDFGALTEENKDAAMRLPELLEKYPGKDVCQIMSAIAPFFPDPNVLIGKQIAVCTNLAPRKFKGYMSQGMIMAMDNPEGGIVFLGPESPVLPGTKIH